jgi:hypothetical protein
MAEPEKDSDLYWKTRKRMMANCGHRKKTYSVFTVNGKPLEYQETMKYLAIKIDYILKFDSHIEYVNSKVVNKVEFLQKIRDSLSHHRQDKLYTTLQ